MLLKPDFGLKTLDVMTVHSGHFSLALFPLRMAEPLAWSPGRLGQRGKRVGDPGTPSHQHQSCRASRERGQVRGGRGAASCCAVQSKDVGQGPRPAGNAFRKWSVFKENKFRAKTQAWICAVRFKTTHAASGEA